MTLLVSTSFLTILFYMRIPDNRSIMIIFFKGNALLLQRTECYFSTFIVSHKGALSLIFHFVFNRMRIFRFMSKWSFFTARRRNLLHCRWILKLALFGRTSGRGSNEHEYAKLRNVSAKYAKWFLWYLCCSESFFMFFSGNVPYSQARKQGKGLW